MSGISSINNDLKSYQQIISLYEECKDVLFNVIPVTIDGFFAANMSSPLGAVLDKLAWDGINQIKLAVGNDRAKTILRKNNFLSYYGIENVIDSNLTTIPYMKLKKTDGTFFAEYVAYKLLENAELPQMSDQLKKKIHEGIYEIFVNAQIHSNTENIYTCGQFFPNKHTIDFTITDTGIGIKKKVNDRFGWNLSSVEAIKWAMIDRNTTKTEITGGIGLAILKEFIMRNKGMMQIVSDDGFYQFGYEGESTSLLSGRFPGTVVNLEFKTDDICSYSLKSEIDKKDIF